MSAQEPGRGVEAMVIVGGGLAGLSAARAARSLGFAGPLTIVGDEPGRPYDRPPLSKEYLSGATGAEALRLVPDDDPLLSDATWVRAGATRLVTDPAGRAHEVLLSDGRALTADAIVLATGSTARPPEVAGLPPARNVHVLRTAADADALRAALRPGTRLGIVGAGLIGSEVASTASELGCEVTLVSAAEVPLVGFVGPRLAPALAGRHAEHGVRLLTGRRVVGADHADAAGDAITALRLDDGTSVPVDVVLAAVGGAPATGWLAGSGVTLGDGVLADEAGRTNVPGVVAVGDCAAWFAPDLGRHHRAQHWHDAIDRAPDALAALLGVPAPRTRAYVPYAWSQQYGAMIQVAGRPGLADAMTLDGDPATGPFVADLIREGEPVAAVALDRPRDLTRRRKALARGDG